MNNYSVGVVMQTKPRHPFGWLDIFSFGAGLLCMVYLNMGGNLYLAEIFLLILLPYLIYSRRSLLNFRPTKLIVLLGVGWLFNQIVADLYRGTSVADILKGWALIAIFLTNFLGIYLLVFPSPRRVALGLLGYSIGFMLQTVLQPNGNMLFDIWKFGIGGPFTLFICVIGVFVYIRAPRKILWWNFFLIMVSLYSFYVRTRSLGGTALLTAFIVWFRFTRVGRRFAQRINNPLNIVFGGLLLMAVVWGIIQVYGYVAEQGYLGEIAQNLYQKQAYGDFGILLGGRREWLPALHAIMDSPVIGFGSYARNTDYGQYLYDLTSMGYVVNNNQIDAYLAIRNTIPTHSHLLQGWVWAGLAGGVFWFFILTLTIRTLVMAFRHPNPLFMVTVFLCMSAIWAVLFSPLSNIGRLQWAFILVTFLYTLSYQPEGAGEEGFLGLKKNNL